MSERDRGVGGEILSTLDTRRMDEKRRVFPHHTYRVDAISLALPSSAETRRYLVYDAPDAKYHILKSARSKFR